MGRFHNNQRFTQLTDEHLKELLKLRLSNDRFDGKITEIVVAHKKNGNNDNEPYWVGFEFKTVQYGWEEQGIMFKRFSIDEWDYIHRCLEELNVCPVSDYVLIKKGEITNLECSNRGYQSVMKSMKETLKNLYEQIST